ncbi:MAG: methyl-accepting chemotaxis protein [Bradymonadia bacterium]
MFSTIRSKLMLITALGTVTVFLTLGLGMYALRDSIVSERLLAVEQLIDVGHGLIVDAHRRVEAGELTREAAMKRVEGELKQMRFGDNGYFFVYGYDGTNLIHVAKPQLQGKNLYDFKDPSGKLLIQALIKAAQSESGRGTVEYMWPKAKGEEPVAKVGHARGFAPWKLFIGTGAYVDDINSVAFGQMAFFGGIVLLLCGFGFVFSWRIAGRLSDRLCALRRTMGQLAEGSTHIELDTSEAGELGEMARSVDVFRQHAEARTRLEAEQDRIKAEAETARQASIRQIADDLETRLGQVASEMKHMSGQLNQQVQMLNDSSHRTHDFAQTVSSASQMATDNVEMVAAATQELDASSREINGQMERSAQLAEQAAQSAEAAGGHLTALSEATRSVGEITDVIGEVAEQTNLLALNATIEAARAGDAGKGFAVVADEVKSLAGQTQSAINNIGSQISATQTTARQTVSSMGEISGHIYEVRDASTTVAAAVTEQSSAISEISRNIEAVTQATRGINGTISQLVEEMSQSQGALTDVGQVSEQVRSVAIQLEQAVQQVVSGLRASA